MKSLPELLVERRQEVLDYSNPNLWLHFPPALSSAPQDSPPADVFFVCGTLQEQGTSPWLDIGPHQALLSEFPYRAQASAFAQAGRIFQPQYRQATIETFLRSDSDITQAMAVPVADIHQAFLHYLSHYNQGRPFLLVGNSQGSIVLLNLMQEVLADPAKRAHFIAAYLIGYSVTPADLVHSGMKLAAAPDDLGVIITYNTLAKGATQARTLLPHALCVNPLNWVNTSEYAPRSLHLGAVSFDENGKHVTPNYTDAWIDPQLGALIIGEAQPERPLGFFPPGDLHSHNISYFYNNLAQNAELRVQAGIKKWGQAPI